MTQTEDSFPYKADFETQIWDEERFERLLRQAAFLQRSLSHRRAPARKPEPSQGCSGAGQD